MSVIGQLSAAQRAEFLAGVSYMGLYPMIVNNLMDLIGDSRTQDQGTNGTPVGQSGVHFLNHYNATNGNRITVYQNQGWAGSRSDQWLKGLSSANVQVRQGIDALVSSPSAWVLIGFPIVNDLAQSAAGYVEQVGGVAVTAANVADVAFANIKAAILRLLAAGKRVIVTPEPGATNLPVAAIGQLHRFNYLLRRLVETTDRVYTWNPLKVLWTASTPTSITMAPNVMRNPGSVDPTHYSVEGGRVLGGEFAITANPMFPRQSYRPYSLHDNPAVNPGQMTPNALFTRVMGDGFLPAPVAGKTSGGVVVSSGTVPAGYEIKGSANSSVAITIADEPNGLGKVVTFAITSTAADNVQIIANAPSAASWNLTDNFQQQADIAVAAGSVNAWTYSEMQINTDLGTDSYFALFADANYKPFPTVAYNYTLYSQVGKVKAGSVTKGYVSARISTVLTAAGSTTISVSCPDFRRW